MRKKIIVILAVLGIVMGSCKKEVINPESSKMEKKYYTQEGDEYILKMASKNFQGEVLAAPVTAAPVVQFNLPNFTALTFVLDIATSESIIPLQCNLSYINTVPTTIADISSIYYTCVEGSSPNQDKYMHHQALSKLIPLSDKIYFTSNQFYGYNLRYDAVALSTNDFMNPNSGLSFTFTPELAAAMNDNASGTFFTIPAGTYRVSMTFLYFQLVKKNK